MAETCATIRTYYLGPKLKGLEATAGVTAPPAKAPDTFVKERAEFAARVDAVGRAILDERAAARTAAAAAVAENKRLQADLDALRAGAQPAPVVVAPAPPAPPSGGPVLPPAGGSLHPDEIQAIKLGRGGNYALMRTAGFRNDRPLLRPSATTLPANVRLVSPWYGWPLLWCDAPADFSGFDTRGFQIYWQQPFEVKMENGIIGSDGVNMIPPVMYGGPPDLAAKMTLKNVTFDQKCMKWEPNRGSCMNGFPTVLEAESLRLTRLASSWANFGPGQVVRLNGFYSEGPGQYAYYPLDAPDTGQKDHPEIIHQHGADIEIVNAFYDARYPSHPIPPVPEWIKQRIEATKNDPAPFVDPPERRIRHGMGTGIGLLQYRTDPKPYAPGRIVHREMLLLNHPDSAYYYNWQITMDTDVGFPGVVRFEDTAQQMPFAVDGSGAHTTEGSGIDMPMNKRLSGLRNVCFETGNPLPGNINRAA